MAAAGADAPKFGLAVFAVRHLARDASGASPFDDGARRTRSRETRPAAARGRLDGHAAGSRIHVPCAAKADQIGNGASAHRAGIEFAGDPTALDQYDAARDIEHQFEILLDDEHRETMLFAQRPQELADFLDDGRLDALRGLIEKEQPGQWHECAGERQDLLLAARQRAASAFHEPAQPRENSEDALDRPLFGLAGIRCPGKAQILVRAQSGEDTAALGYVSDAKPAALVCRP